MKILGHLNCRRVEVEMGKKYMKKKGIKRGKGKKEGGKRGGVSG